MKGAAKADIEPMKAEHQGQTRYLFAIKKLPLEANQKHDDIFASIIPCHHRGKSSRGQLKNQMPVEYIYCSRWENSFKS